MASASGLGSKQKVKNNQAQRKQTLATGVAAAAPHAKQLLWQAGGCACPRCDRNEDPEKKKTCSTWGTKHNTCLSKTCLCHEDGACSELWRCVPSRSIVLARIVLVKAAYAQSMHNETTDLCEMLLKKGSRVTCMEPEEPTSISESQGVPCNEAPPDSLR